MIKILSKLGIERNILNLLKHLEKATKNILKGERLNVSPQIKNKEKMPTLNYFYSTLCPRSLPEQIGTKKKEKTHTKKEEIKLSLFQEIMIWDTKKKSYWN